MLEAYASTSARRRVPCESIAPIDIQLSTPSDTMPEAIAACELSIRVINTLRAGGVTTVEQLLTKREIDLFRISGLGRRYVKEIKTFLSKYNLGLRSAN